MTNQPKKIQVKETQKYYGDIDGKLEDIISSLQAELDAGWEGIESEYEWDYGAIGERKGRESKSKGTKT